MALLWKERELRNQKAEEGLLWCGIHKSFLPKEKFGVWKGQGNNYGHRPYCRECESNKYYWEDKERWNTQQNTKNRAIKQKYVDLLGGECQRCGYKQYIAALEFHHIENKDTEINKLLYNGTKREQLCMELNKCCILCSNCHRAYTARDWTCKFIHRPDGIGYTIDHESIQQTKTV